MTELLSLRGISKVYPSVVANDNVNLDIDEGEIHAILGENGAGKSTLMKLIYGVSQPDNGTIQWRGQTVTIKNPAHARSLGIGMVFQHFSLFETLTVAQNISLAVSGSIASLSKRITDVADSFGLPIAPDTMVHSLSVGERQRVEIVRCILQEPRLLIMDEPTSVLPPQGVDLLFATLRKLAQGGCSILYISHKLEEIRSLCDNATVLRDGKVVATVTPTEETTQSLARLMIGRDIPVTRQQTASSDGRVMLDVNQLSHTPEDPFGTSISDASLSVAAGEIVGIAGISGNGQNELMRLISGESLLHSSGSGTVSINGSKVNRLSPEQRRQLGFAFVPEERIGRGAVPDLSLGFNSLLTSHNAGLTRFGFIRFAAMAERAQQCIKDNDVRCGGDNALAGSLSGGNLQKFIVGREMALAPQVLVLSQPTWGVDVGAAADIRQALIELRNKGTAILLVSEEIEELFEVCDRLHVIYEGKLSESLRTAETNVQQVGQWMSGQFLSSPRADGLQHFDNQKAAGDSQSPAQSPSPRIAP